MDDSAVFELYSRLNNITFCTPQHATYQDFSNRFYCMCFGDEHMCHVDFLSKESSDVGRRREEIQDERNPGEKKFFKG